MPYLALLLFAPWLLILGWAYASYPKSLPRVAARRLFDALALLLAASASVAGALYGFQRAAPPAAVPPGHASGAIWQQVLPALAAYGAYAALLVLALLLRRWIWRRA
ncbi:MAG: hypothetical protein KGJ97_01255 [Xanthomonadaceae bacterium]|jgi:hypothetical protein|nr:hypothetical protein [Xanthomonadaceae bacterium]MDE3073603.1 hypothetical protein [Pseudomonadota bacterium]